MLSQSTSSQWLLDDFPFCGLHVRADYRTLSASWPHAVATHRAECRHTPRSDQPVRGVRRKVPRQEEVVAARSTPRIRLAELQPTLSRWQVGRNESETSVIDRVRFWWYRVRSLGETTIVHRLIESERYRLSWNHALDRNASMFVGAENLSAPDQDQKPYHDRWR